MTGEFLGLTIGQLLTLVGLGLAFLVILFVLSRVLKLTKNLLKLGCLGILVLLAIAFFALRALG
jgi:hypothetical protein